ncbi:MAG: Fic family protein, partial [Chthoniobacteraceae bacterium]
MKKPYWLSREECLALHDLMLSEYGGCAGVRDEGLLESALARPQQIVAYEKPT